MKKHRTLLKRVLFTLLVLITLKTYSQVQLTTAGTGAAYTLQFPGSFTLSTGLVITFKAHTSNTGPATLNINGTGAVSIRKQVSTALVSGDILTNQEVTVVYDGTNFQLMSPSSLSTSTTAWSLGGNNVSSVQNLGTTTAFDLPFITNNTERFRLNSTGTILFPSVDNTLNLGSVANSWNDGYLDGYLYINGQRWTSLLPNNTLIGTKGNESFTSGLYNLGVGAGSGNAITTGTRNTLVGHRSGESVSIASDNTLIGHLAGGLTSTLGNDNTFVGSYAGYGASNSGYSNTYVGIQSGGNNTTGYKNAFFGANTGTSNTTGFYNTFIGDESGGGNTIGNQNTFTGYLSGNSNNTDNNSFYGYTSGKSTTSGSYNTFSGTASGFTNTTGFGNSYYGGTTGYNTNGSYNSFMGYSTGYFATSGDYNTLIGASAGATAAALGVYNTYIGYNASGSASLANGIAIGKNALVTTNNSMALGGTGTDAVRVGVGVTAPLLKMDVRGTNAKATTTAAENILQVASTDALPLALRLGIKTDATAGNRYGSIDVDDNGANRQLVIQPGGGQVGIGTTTPGFKLDVSGAIRSGVDGTSGAYRIYSEQGASDFEVVLRPNAAMTQNTVYSFPPDDGNPNDILKSDGSGNLSWVSPSASGAVTGTGTQNYVTKWNNPGGTAIGNSTIFDNGTNVGIGTTTPAVKFQVANNAAVTDAGSISVLGGTSSNSTYYMGNSTNNYLGAISYDNVTNSMNFWTNNTVNRMVISNAGNVSINALPTATDYLFIDRPSDFGANHSGIYVSRSGNGTAANGGTSWAPTGVDAAIKGYNNWGNNFTATVAGYNFQDFANSAGVIGADAGGNNLGALSFKDASNIQWGLYTPVNASVGGNLGIGLAAGASPTQKLHVVGGARITGLVGPGVVTADATGLLSVSSGSAITGSGTTNYVARWTPTGTQLGIGAIYDNGSNVGVGSIAPGNKLVVEDANNDVMKITRDNTTTATHTAKLIFANKYSGGENVLARIGITDGGTNTGVLTFETKTNTSFPDATTTEKMRITQNGDVGIGTTNPSAKLEVVGDVEVPATSDYTYSSAKTKYFNVAAANFSLIQISGTSSANIRTMSFVTGNALWINGGTLGTTALFTAPIYLPEGAIITNLDVYVWDNDATYNISATLNKITAGTSSMTTVGTTSTSGGPSASVQTISVALGSTVVNNGLYYIRINTVEELSSNNLRIYGARVTYTITNAE